MNLFDYFFAVRDENLFKPCGMFTLPHIIALIVTAVLICVAVYFSKNFTHRKIKLLFKIMALIFTLLEGVKIAYNLVNGYTWLDAWFPLAYCSLFIYSLWLAGFGNKFLEKFGFVFLAGGGIPAGAFFLVFPTTSLMMHPIYHYLCFYSMLFHGAMVYSSIMVLIKSQYKMSAKSGLYYTAFVLLFSIIAIIINVNFDSNMMFYKEPFNMPIEFVVKIYEFSKVAYTLLIFVAYSSLYYLTLGVYTLINKIIKGKKI